MGSQPFSSLVIMSNIEWFKYCWIWDKKIPSGMSYARFQPMRQYEDIMVFCRGRTIYNPQMIVRNKPLRGGGMSKGDTTNNQNLKALHKVYQYKNPTNILTFDKIRRESLHPTQKPLKLMEYLIKLVSKEGATVLDPFTGSGTTLIACAKLGRGGIGIEKEEEYIKIAEARIKPFLIQSKLGDSN